jgi:V/A-type H+-transporting ATPase subunit C
MVEVTIPLVIGGATLAGIAVIAPVTKYALDIYPYLYTNTRCSSRLGLLFNKKFYEELIAATSVKEVFAMLEDTYYSDIVEHSKGFFTISDKLEDDLYQTNAWLLNIVSKNIAPIITAMNLKFEINSIKSVLNSVKEGKNIDPKELRFIGDEQLKLKLESVSDYQSLVSAVEDTAYYLILQECNLDELHKINTLLDRVYIENLVNSIKTVKDSGASAPFMEYVRVLIDLFNTRLTARSLNSDSEEDLIEGGHLKKKDLEGINDLAQLKSVLSSSQYTDFLGKGTLFDIENTFYKYLLKQAWKISAKHTIKSGTVVRFILLKEIEIRNIYTIIKLKTEGFTAEEIEQVLVF